MKTREEAKAYFQAQIGDGPVESRVEYIESTPEKQAHHYGRVEVEELLDFIYGTNEAVKWAEKTKKKREESAKRLNEMLRRQDAALSEEEKLRRIRAEGWRTVCEAIGKKGPE